MTPEQKRELLTLAARACGIECDIVEFGTLGVFKGVNSYGEVVFNPLHSPGDCAEMEDALEIALDWGGGYVIAAAFNFEITKRENYMGKDSRGAARRLASVRVAAEIGRRKEG